MVEGGVKNPEKMLTSFMDGPPSDVFLFCISSALLQILQLRGCHGKVSGNPENYRDSFSSIYFLASFLVFSNLYKFSFLIQIPK